MIASDTIFAVSTGSGRAGIAVVRVSGPRARDVLKQIAGGPVKPRELWPVRLRDPRSGEVIDRGMAVWFAAPKTVTGEDIAEFHVHGSAAVVRKLMGVLAGIAGCRMAEAGEFTRRGFANGKIDLVEAEGLGDLLEAETEGQRRLAMRQLLGETSTVFREWRDDVLVCLSLLEAAIDFSEEDDTAEAALREAIPRIENLLVRLRDAVSQADRAALVRQGFRIVIAGAPNVGKSSLLNALLQREAAIVSPIAGTTRDVIEAGLVIDGVPVTLSDTAGLRGHTDDPIEQMGIARSAREIADADLLIWVTAPDVDELAKPAKSPDLIVAAKADLAGQAQSIHTRNESHLAVSSKTGVGVDALRMRLAALIAAKSAGAESAVVVRERHKLAILESIRLLNEILLHPDSALEVKAENMRKAAHALDSLTGHVDSEDVLGQIFSRFCIGK
jgi:tRNA modification GTPase